MFVYCENEVTLNLEIRHLPRNVVSELGNILEICDSWKDVMGCIPSLPWVPGENIPSDDYYKRKYSQEEIRLVSAECARSGQTGLEILVVEWGTSGRIRPIVKDLIQLCKRVGQDRAAHYLKTLIEGEESSPNVSNEFEELENLVSYTNLDDGNAPAATNTLHTEEDQNLLTAIQDCSLPHICYSDLKISTNDFSNIPSSSGGPLIGKGAFGVVYKANIKILNNEVCVAIKQLISLERQMDKQLKTELDILSKCVHPNILKLEGYSIDGPHWCLIYAYMKNGSLQDHIEHKIHPPLAWKMRLKILNQTAEGIVYLHSNFEPPLVHRDIKSANILLDVNLDAKVGDFGLAHPGGHGLHTHTKVLTETVVGTSAYMAPEAFRGDISVKMDTFSFGIVLLEVLTGLPSFDEKREDRDLLSHITELGLSKEILDKTAGDWDDEIVKCLFILWEDLCAYKKSKRASMIDVAEKLKQIIQ